MNEEFDGGFMHKITLGKRQRLAHQAPHPLADGVVIAFDVIGFATSLATVVLERGHNLRLSCPEVTGAQTVAQTGFVGGGNALPQHTARRFTATTHSIGNDLPGAPAQCQPQPTLVFASEHPCPHFV